MVRGIDTAAAVLPAKRKDANHPDAGRLITALRQIGYSLEQALADLIDNSINAGARNVLVRFLHDGSRIRALAVVDDGHGMSEVELYDAMRFGSREKDDPDTLGKFGMGMKLASLSHARSLTVFSRSDGGAAARRWTTEGIRSGWLCERLRADTAAAMLDRPWGPMDLSDGGTVLIWEDIDRLPSHRSGLRYTLGSLERRLRLHLGLCFHRFIESGQVSIMVDQLLVDREGQGLQATIDPLNPFGYPESGAAGYPRKMTAELAEIGPLALEGHIWPANSELPEYRLGRRASARQGLYFYRNDRLIQAGGWNGLLHDETEPHSSLARVVVDLPLAYDDWFGINVQKSNVLVPPGFDEILNARASDGTTFEDFRRVAVESYRRANVGSHKRAPYPTAGLRRQLVRGLQDLYGRSDQPTEGFSVGWKRLRVGTFFQLDQEQGRLILNSRYRISGAREAEDILKLLLALLVRNDFSSKTAKFRERELASLNEMLVSLCGR